MIYDGNEQLTKVHLDNNSIRNVLIPANLKVLTVAFNGVSDLSETCQ